MRILLAALLAIGIFQPVHAVTFLTEDNPPLNFTREGKLQGISTAVVLEMAKRAGIPAETSMIAWTEAYSRTQVEPDACVYSTARLGSRNNLFQWVGPISRGYWSAFALDGFNEKLTKVDDLKAFRIGIVNDARATYLRERGFTLLVENNRDRDSPAKLTLERNKPGGIDLWVTQGYTAREVAREAGVPGVKEVFSAIMSQDYWLACNLKMPRETVRALTNALNEMKKDGTYRKLTDLPRNN